MYFKECCTQVPLWAIRPKDAVWLLPVYSATEAKEEAADAVSQSRSVLRLGLRLRIGKASSDSTLQAERQGARAALLPATPGLPVPSGQDACPLLQQGLPVKVSTTSRGCHQKCRERLLLAQAERTKYRSLTGAKHGKEGPRGG